MALVDEIVVAAKQSISFFEVEIWEARQDCSMASNFAEAVVRNMSEASCCSVVVVAVVVDDVDVAVVVGMILVVWGLLGKIVD